MKSDNRWVYIVGVAVLAALVVVGLIWRGDDSASSDSSSAGDGGVAVGDGAVADSAAGSSASARSDGAALGTISEDAGDPIGAVPEDPAECRTYCGELVERGAVAEGMDQDACVRQLCPSGEESESSGEGEAAGEAVQTITEPDVPEMPEDCQAQCRLLQSRGELRTGTTLEDCFSALCGSSDEEESAEEE